MSDARLRGTKKPTVYRDPAQPWLMSLSKAALCDCVLDLLRGMQDSADDPVPVEAAIERLTPVLALRGDRLPAVYHGLALRARVERERALAVEGEV